MTDCVCFQPTFDYRDFVTAALGVDMTHNRYGEVSVLTCKHCGTHWLFYRVEYEAFTSSGRWFRGPITAPELIGMTPQAAVPFLEGLPWYFAGGSYFSSPGLRSSGKVQADL